MTTRRYGAKRAFAGFRQSEASLIVLRARDHGTALRDGVNWISSRSRGHGIFRRALSVPHPARLFAPGVRRLRAKANFLGIRYFAGASPLSADDHSVYRRTRLAWR